MNDDTGTGWKSPPPTIEEMLDSLDQNDPRVQDIRRMYKRIAHIEAMDADEPPPMIIAHMEWCNAVLEAKVETGSRGPLHVILAEALEELRQFTAVSLTMPDVTREKQ